MSGIQCWLESSLRRVYPRTPAGTRKVMTVLAARNDRLSFQVCLRNPSLEQEASAEVSAESPDDVQVQLRRVGYVSQPHLNTGTSRDEIEGIEHIPGCVPDPLYPESAVTLGPGESHSFWVTLTVPPDIEPGPRKVRLTVKTGKNERRNLTAVIDVQPFTIQPRRDFLVGHWFYADALCDRYKVEPYEKRFWDVVKPYMTDYLGHENNTMFVPHLTPPINGEHRPQQLLKVSVLRRGGYRFDFTDVRRWIRMARSFGADHFLFSHLFTQWGAKHAARVCLSNREPNSLLWPRETEATAPVYRNFLSQYLPRLREFLKKEGLLERTYIQMSDEPHSDEHLANYRKGKGMVREIAPWIRAMDGLSDVRFYKEGLCEMPIAGLGAASSFREEGIPHCVYYCCGPRGPWLNRLLDTPLVKIRMSGWLFYRLGAAGFMHWGYNYWYRGCTPEPIDPFVEQAMGEWPFIPYGDPFVVYPGKDGPLDSIRWEVFAESLRDYALLQSGGITPDDPMLSPIKGYDDFPKTETWLRNTRRKVLQGRAD